MSTLSFPIEKYEGTGNDFIIVDEWQGEVVPEAYKSAVAGKLCRRGESIGADGVLYWSRSPEADGRMRTFNADGSEAEICGNGLRCVASYAFTNGQIKTTSLRVATMKGVSELNLLLDDKGNIDRVRVLIAAPVFTAGDIPMTGEPSRLVLDEEFFVSDEFGVLKITALTVGNPHVVIFVSDLEKTDVARLGAVIDRHPAFPNRTNVNFVQIFDNKGFGIKTFERGVGLTLSCGTGVVSSTAAGAVTGRLLFDTEVTAVTGGGRLGSECARDGDSLKSYLIGPARRLFRGRTALDITPDGPVHPEGLPLRNKETFN